jgi:hypothetical protein
MSVNYAFTNTNGQTQFTNDNQFNYQGAWTNSGTYSPPLAVVSYGNGMYIALALNINAPPPTSGAWTELVQVGGGTPAITTNLNPFTPSGPAHASGIVPDPGSVEGKHNFMREDATWALPGGHIRQVVTGAVTLDDDTVLMSGSPSVITLPDATASTGKRLAFKLIGTSGTIQAFGTQAIDVIGNSFVMTGPASALTIQSDGAQWWMLSGSSLDYISYPGPPTVVPPAVGYIVVDVNGVQWQYLENTWV